MEEMEEDDEGGEDEATLEADYEEASAPARDGEDEGADYTPAEDHEEEGDEGDEDDGHAADEVTTSGPAPPYEDFHLAGLESAAANLRALLISEAMPLADELGEEDMDEDRKSVV
jgi:hypothetical protein